MENGFKHGVLDFLNGWTSRYVMALLPHEPGYDYALAYRQAVNKCHRYVYDHGTKEGLYTALMNSVTG